MNLFIDSERYRRPRRTFIGQVWKRLSTRDRDNYVCAYDDPSTHAHQLFLRSRKYFGLDNIYVSSCARARYRFYTVAVSPSLRVLQHVALYPTKRNVLIAAAILQFERSPIILSVVEHPCPLFSSLLKKGKKYDTNCRRFFVVPKCMIWSSLPKILPIKNNNVRFSNSSSPRHGKNVFFFHQISRKLNRVGNPRSPNQQSFLFLWYFKDRALRDLEKKKRRRENGIKNSENESWPKVFRTCKRYFRIEL